MTGLMPLYASHASCGGLRLCLLGLQDGPLVRSTHALFAEETELAGVSVRIAGIRMMSRWYAWGSVRTCIVDPAPVLREARDEPLYGLLELLVSRPLGGEFLSRRADFVQQSGLGICLL